MSSRSACWVVLGLLVAPAWGWAQGGPPMITDDPGTPGPGNWEVNVAATGSRFVLSTEGESPLLDLNYGVGERVQLKYEVPWVTQSDAGRLTRSGLGNSLLGVKWRFYDHGPDAWMISMYPQVELRNPSSRSSQRGLADEGTGTLLPVELQRKYSDTGLNIEVGRELRSRGQSGWFGGVVVGQDLNDRLEVLSEIRGESSSAGQGSAVAINLGSRVSIPGWGALLISVGRDLRNTLEERSLVFGYVGWQFSSRNDWSID